MNINLTILVQMFNFFVAYTIITRFFLAPLFTLVMQDEHEKKLLNDQVAHEAKKLAAQQILKQEQWSTCQREFQLRKADMTIMRSRVKEEKYSIEVPPKIEPAKIHELVNRVVTALKEKVTHSW